MAVPGLYACRCVVSALTTFVSDDLLIMFDGAPSLLFSALEAELACDDQVFVFFH